MQEWVEGGLLKLYGANAKVQHEARDQQKKVLEVEAELAALLEERKRLEDSIHDIAGNDAVTLEGLVPSNEIEDNKTTTEEYCNKLGGVGGLTAVPSPPTRSPVILLTVCEEVRLSKVALVEAIAVAVKCGTN